MEADSVAISDARANLTEIVNSVRLLGRCVVLTQRGRPRAAIVPLEVFEAIRAGEALTARPKGTARARRAPSPR